MVFYYVVSYSFGFSVSPLLFYLNRTGPFFYWSGSGIHTAYKRKQQYTDNQLRSLANVKI